MGTPIGCERRWGNEKVEPAQRGPGRLALQIVGLENREAGNRVKLRVSGGQQVEPAAQSDRQVQRIVGEQAVRALELNDIGIDEYPRADRDGIEAHCSKKSACMLARNCSGVSAKSGVERNRRRPASAGTFAVAGVSLPDSRTVSSAWALVGSVTGPSGETRPWSSSTSTVV